MSHSLYDWARIYLDRLGDALRALCRSLRAQRALIALTEEEGLTVIADWGVDLENQTGSSHELDADEGLAFAVPVTVLGFGEVALAVGGGSGLWSWARGRPGAATQTTS